MRRSRSLFALCAKQTCSCGEPSLFHQRAKGWDVSRHRFFFKYLRMITTCRKLSYRGFFARVVAVHDTALILNDWVSLFYTVIILIILPSRVVVFQGLLGAWAFQVRRGARTHASENIPWLTRARSMNLLRASSGPSSGPPPARLRALRARLATSALLQMIAYSLFNLVVLKPKGLDVGSEVIVLFPIIYKLPCIIILRFYAMLYNMLYYVPFVRNKVCVCARVF